MPTEHLQEPAMRMSPTEASADAEARSIGEVMDALRAIVRAFRVETRAIERQLGISLAQLWVLRRLDEGPADSLNDLAETAGTHQSSMSTVVRRLVDKDLVTRSAHPADRRRNRLQLTPAGRSLLQKAPVTLEMKMLRSLRQLGPENTAALAVRMGEWLTAAGMDPKALLPIVFEDD